MSETTSQSETIRQRLRAAYVTLDALVHREISALPSDLLYAHPLQDEWSIMQNLAHIVEFLPYWANEVDQLLAVPGCAFGRTQQHTGRLQAIADNEYAPLATVIAELPHSYARLEASFEPLSDEELEVEGVHSTKGVRTLDWFIEEFITGHLEAHNEQLRALLAALS